MGSITFDELAEHFLKDYSAKHKKQATRRTWRIIERLKAAERQGLYQSLPIFKGMEIMRITTTRIEAYAETRQKEGADNTAINRELRVLRRILNTR
jgi:hypothetical protein